MSSIILAVAAASSRPLVGVPAEKTGMMPGSANCTESWFTQTTDHFGFAPTAGYSRTFQQRFFVCQNGVEPTDAAAIWFYCGNEANVELYVNATGLMWENSKLHEAVMVFAEHRYYGRTSIPGPSGATPGSAEQLRFLSMEQALADYATLIKALPAKLGIGQKNLPVVAFGGSYGGMLAGWLRMKYPSAVVGAIAASAPILAFPGNIPAYDTNSYWRVVTRDATPAAGAEAGCDSNVRAAFSAIWRLGNTAAGRGTLGTAFRLCQALETYGDVNRLAMMMLNAWDTMAMGNFPFASDYLVFQQTGDSSVTMPPFPVRVACEWMTNTTTASSTEAALLEAMRRASGVLYNVTGTEECLELPSDPEYDGIWDFQYCSELLPQETYFSLNGTKDMFWARPQNMSAIAEHCLAKYGFSPREDWIAIEFGSARGVHEASNIVFSNGLMDPWSSGGVGVTEASRSPTSVASLGQDGSVKAVVIPNGAHHLDLMFATSNDPADVTKARTVEMTQIKKWTESWWIETGRLLHT